MDIGKKTTMEMGWIRIHRKIMKKCWFSNAKYVQLWVFMLLSANHQESEFMWNGEVMKLKPGQFITSILKIQKELRLAHSTAEKILKLFEKEHQIEQQKTTKFRVITILNWDLYQQNGQQNGQQRGNRGVTEGQQRGTNNNNKNKENEKNSSDEVAKTEKPPLNKDSKQADSQHDSNHVSGTTEIKETSAADNAIPLVIKMFEAVNPTVYKLYGNTTERSACERLLKLMPIDKLKIIITRVLPILNADKYAKGKSIKPSQLENNLGFVKAYIDQQQSTRLVHHVTE